MARVARFRHKTAHRRLNRHPARHWRANLQCVRLDRGSEGCAPARCRRRAGRRAGGPGSARPWIPECIHSAYTEHRDTTRETVIARFDLRQRCLPTWMRLAFETAVINAVSDHHLPNSGLWCLFQRLDIKSQPGACRQDADSFYPYSTLRACLKQHSSPTSKYCLLLHLPTLGHVFMLYSYRELLVDCTRLISQ